MTLINGYFRGSCWEIVLFFGGFTNVIKSGRHSFYDIRTENYDKSSVFYPLRQQGAAGWSKSTLSDVASYQKCFRPVNGRSVTKT